MVQSFGFGLETWAKLNKMVLNGVKFGQTGISRAKQGKTYAKESLNRGETRLNRLKWGVTVINRSKMGLKWVKWE